MKYAFNWTKGGHQFLKTLRYYYDNLIYIFNFFNINIRGTLGFKLLAMVFKQNRKIEWQKFQKFKKKILLMTFKNK